MDKDDKHKYSHTKDFSKRNRSTSIWDNLNFSQSTIASLREICKRCKDIKSMSVDPDSVKNNLRENGLSAILSGPSGTSKTLAASLIAKDLGLELSRVDLSTVISKYIGETEKNLSKVFAKAKVNKSILFFDEADALFSKRVEVKDSHDRFANLEVSHLLEKIEEYEGLVVLAIKHKKNIDPAFIRRTTYIVEV